MFKSVLLFAFKFYRWLQSKWLHKVWDITEWFSYYSYQPIFRKLYEMSKHYLKCTIRWSIIDMSACYKRISISVRLVITYIKIRNWMRKK